MKNYAAAIFLFLLTGCSLIGKSNTPMAPYKALSHDNENNIEVRLYENLILVSTPIDTSAKDGRNKAFMRLFNYISGANISNEKIAMTTPVLVNTEKDKGTKILMTAPVFMDTKNDQESLMSFVLPQDFKWDTTPKPKNPQLQLHRLNNYTVAAIKFSGLMTENNIAKYKEILDKWIISNGYNKIGGYKIASYNPPFTIPFFRRNEVLIPIEIK